MTSVAGGGDRAKLDETDGDAFGEAKFTLLANLNVFITLNIVIERPNILDDHVVQYHAAQRNLLHFL